MVYRSCLQKQMAPWIGPVYTEIYQQNDLTNALRPCISRTWLSACCKTQIITSSLARDAGLCTQKGAGTILAELPGSQHQSDPINACIAHFLPAFPQGVPNPGTDSSFIALLKIPRWHIRLPCEVAYGNAISQPQNLTIMEQKTMVHV